MAIFKGVILSRGRGKERKKSDAVISHPTKGRGRRHKRAVAIFGRYSIKEGKEGKKSVRCFHFAVQQGKRKEAWRG